MRLKITVYGTVTNKRNLNAKSSTMPQLFWSSRILVRLSRVFVYELTVVFAGRQVCTTNVKLTMQQLFSSIRILVRLSRVFVWAEGLLMCCRETGMHIAQPMSNQQCRNFSQAFVLLWNCPVICVWADGHLICCRETGMHHLRLLHRLGQLAALMFFPCWLLVGLFFFLTASKNFLYRKFLSFHYRYSLDFLYNFWDCVNFVLKNFCQQIILLLRVFLSIKNIQKMEDCKCTQCKKLYIIRVHMNVSWSFFFCFAVQEQRV